jgi:phospholipid/cholesterol/gamma-HCH transport system permease protein
MINFIGFCIYNFLESIKQIFSNRIENTQFVKEAVFIAYESLPMILVLTAVSSMIITVNTATELVRYGGRELIGGAVSISNLQEITPIFIAFALAARCGTAITAEIATMKVTEQLNALYIFRIDRLYYLLTPKILAALLLSPFIYMMSCIVSLLAGMIMCYFLVDLEFYEFLESAWKFTKLHEFYKPLLKTEIFTMYTIVVCVSLALRCENNSKAVGLVTSFASTLSIIGVVIINGFLTSILN